MQWNEHGGDAGTVASANRIEQFCSFAALGRTEAFQAIFVCRSCCCCDDKLLCICSACADQCHFDHDVEYVGMGPCYCDCSDIGCKIADESKAEADRLGILSFDGKLCSYKPVIAGSAPPAGEKVAAGEPSYIRDVFRIPLLDDTTTSYRLTLQAKELVKHSRDTFWLDADTVSDNDGSLCDLELLAWKIFRQHMHHYNLREAANDSGHCIGAEWWVQVKQVSLPPPSEASQSRLETYANGEEAVDLHYDKDEELAESFGLGLFPTLSTVTYLTDSVNAPPTLVFSRRYDEGDDNAISEMLISHPMVAKHLAFDGRLLHGAPSHFALRPLFERLRNEEMNVNATTRITFLVNLWLSHKPAGVEVLPNAIREAVQMAANDVSGTTQTVLRTIQGPATFTASPVAQIDLTDEEDLPEALRGKIELPFVGGKATWGDDEDGSMILVTYPPPAHECDTLLVRFGPGLEASLQHSDNNDEI